MDRLFAGNALKKVAVSGGAAITLAEVAVPLGGTWTERDTIVFVPAPGMLSEVPANGGSAMSIMPKMIGAAVWPQALPGGIVVIFTANTGPASPTQANVVAYPLGGEPRVRVRGGFFGRYVESGHLVYVSQGTLFAVPFDPDALAGSGNAVPVLEGVRFNPGATSAQFAASRADTLAYFQGGTQGADRPLSWLDARGTTTRIANAGQADDRCQNATGRLIVAPYTVQGSSNPRNRAPGRRRQYIPALRAGC